MQKPQFSGADQCSGGATIQDSMCPAEWVDSEPPRCQARSLEGPLVDFSQRKSCPVPSAATSSSSDWPRCAHSSWETSNFLDTHAGLLACLALRDLYPGPMGEIGAFFFSFLFFFT